MAEGRKRTVDRRNSSVGDPAGRALYRLPVLSHHWDSHILGRRTLCSHRRAGPGQDEDGQRSRESSRSRSVCASSSRGSRCADMKHAHRFPRRSRSEMDCLHSSARFASRRTRRRLSLVDHSASRWRLASPCCPNAHASGRWHNGRKAEPGTGKSGMFPRKRRSSPSSKRRSPTCLAEPVVVLVQAEGCACDVPPRMRFLQSGRAWKLRS